MSELLLRDRTWDQVTPESAGWRYLHFGVRSGAFESQTGDVEIALVPLSGSCRVESEDGGWELGGRESVFDGMPWALYLPRDTAYRVDAEGEVAICGARCEIRRVPVLVRPEDVEVEVRGAGNATRQINHIIKPEFPAERLLVVEVFTPAGNWSSYPPHKHDASEPCRVVNEEIYYYRIRGEGGFGYHTTYTGAEHEAAGLAPIDETHRVRDHDVVLVPHGYHGPCVAAPGYEMYYLNVMAGPGAERELAFCDDPAHGWVRDTWTDQPTDPRCPMTSAAGRRESR
jgi:5-deoxy-glucuronate isomerase